MSSVKHMSLFTDLRHLSSTSGDLKPSVLTCSLGILSPNYRPGKLTQRWPRPWSLTSADRPLNAGVQVLQNHCWELRRCEMENSRLADLVIPNHNVMGACHLGYSTGDQVYGHTLTEVLL